MINGPFRAGLAWEVDFQPSVNLLRLHGTCYDTISTVCAAHWLSGDIDALPNVLNMILNPIAARASDDLRLTDLLYQTMHAENDKEMKNHGLIDDTKEAFQQWLIYQTFLALSPRNHDMAERFLRDPGSASAATMHTLKVSGNIDLVLNLFKDFQHEVWKNLPLILGRPPSAQDIVRYWSIYEENSFHQGWAKVSTNRSLFRTEKGFLGLGPRDMQPGDSIFILKGAAVPYVFRKCKTKGGVLYELQGDAYLHGIMYGEVNQAEVKWEKLVVC